MKKKITLAAYLAGVTTIAVSLPAMAERSDDVSIQKVTGTAQTALASPKDEKSS